MNNVHITMTPARIIFIFITTHSENTVFIFLSEKEAMKVIIWPWLRQTNWPEAKGTLDSSFLHDGSGHWGSHGFLSCTYSFSNHSMSVFCVPGSEDTARNTQKPCSPGVQSLQGEAHIEWMSTARKTWSLSGVSVLKGPCPWETSHREPETDSEMWRGIWDLHRKPRALPTEEGKQVQGEGHWITAIQSGSQRS